MRRSLCGIVAALALAAYAAPAAAASSVEVTMIYNPFVIYPGEIDAWFVGVDGHISAGRGGLQASTIDLRSDLDVAEVDAGLVVEPRLDFEEHKFGIEFWRVAYCGFENLRRDLTYSDQFYPAGVEVKTALLFKSVSLLYEYDIIHHPRGAYSLGPVFGIDFLATEADLEAATGSGFESVHTTLPLVGWPASSRSWTTSSWPGGRPASGRGPTLSLTSRQPCSGGGAARSR